jgi:hypothetical protein
MRRLGKHNAGVWRARFPGKAFGLSQIHSLYRVCYFHPHFAFFALGLIGLFIALSPYDLPEGWESRLLPPQLKTTNVLYKKHWGIWRDQCEFVAYDLAEPTLLAIDKRRLAFFADAIPPPASRDGSQFIKWRETPVEDSAPKNVRLFATGAYRGCIEPHDQPQLPPELSTIVSRLDEAGGYYTITRNGYGMIVVLPEVGVVLFLYST